MRPSDLLAPQPPTVPGEDSRAVWGLILNDLLHGALGEWMREHPSPTVGLGRVTELCREREAQKYGHRLPVDSVGDSRKDELQDALDGMASSRETWEREKLACAASIVGSAVVYQRHWERGQRAWARHLRCLQTVLELLEELAP